MKKLKNIHIYISFIFLFCHACFICFQGSFLNSFAFADVSTSEIEIKEYQMFEHGVPTASEIETTNTNDITPSKNYTIVIDAGHGGPDPGSIGYKTKIYESEINLKISKMLQQKLEQSGINVVLTRTSSDALAEGRGKAFKKRDMEMRRDIIKNTRPNMVISVHQNSFTNHTLRGAQVFYDKTSEISKQIADMIQSEFLKTVEHSNKSISPGNYYMLKCTAAPSVIVECGFLSHPEEEQLLQTEEHQNKITTAIAKGILNFISTIK